MERSWRERLEDRFNTFCQEANLTNEQRNQLQELMEEFREMGYEEGQNNVFEAYNY
jgi:Spy/CpxP family protein refolding chaperone